MNKESWEYYFFLQDMGVFENPGGVYQKKLKEYEGKTLNEYTNELGEKGWEMVNCIPYSTGIGTTTGFLFIFKRPKR